MNKIEKDYTMPSFVEDPQFNDCILIGIGASFEHVKADGDILFSTPENKLLISKGVVYLNGEKVGECNGNILAKSILESFVFMRANAFAGVQ